MASTPEISAATPHVKHDPLRTPSRKLLETSVGRATEIGSAIVSRLERQSNYVAKVKSCIDPYVHNLEGTGRQLNKAVAHVDAMVLDPVVDEYEKEGMAAACRFIALGSVVFSIGVLNGILPSPLQRGGSLSIWQTIDALLYLPYKLVAKSPTESASAKVEPVTDQRKYCHDLGWETGNWIKERCKRVYYTVSEHPIFNVRQGKPAEAGRFSWLSPRAWMDHFSQSIGAAANPSSQSKVKENQ